MRRVRNNCYACDSSEHKAEWLRLVERPPLDREIGDLSQAGSYLMHSE